MVNRIEQMEKIQKECLEIFKKKNTDYNDAFAKCGLIGILVRIEDKLMRSINITNTNIQLVDESIKDTLLDLHNYAAMALMLIDENKNI